MERELEALIRTDNKHSQVTGLREKGMVPAVVYGKNVGSIAIAVDARELQDILKEASNALISMKIMDNGKGKKHKVLVKAVQRDPIRRDLVHADFHQVSLKDRVHASVPIRLTGNAPGVAEGGVLTTLLRRLEVECLAGDIPEAITADVSGLAMGQTLTVAGLELPANVKTAESLQTPVVTVAAAVKPGAAETASEEAAEEAAEEPGDDKAK